MRDAYLNMLYYLAQQDDNVLALVADNGLIVYDKFREDFPQRFYNFGISEGNMVAAAAGMASAGKIPFVYTISSFLVYRSYEFLRNDICMQNLNVKIIGIGSGITYSTLGPTHHTTEDIGMLRSIPNLTVFSPATKTEVEWIMKKTYEIKGPVYIRLSNNKQDYYDGNQSFEIGIPSVVKHGNGTVILTTGSMLNVAMNVVEDISEIAVLSMHTLKPVNGKKLVESLRTYDQIIVLEDHNTIGGLYTLLAEVMTEYCITKKVLRVGLDDCFAEGYGSIEDVREMNGLDNKTVRRKIKTFVEECYGR